MRFLCLHGTGTNSQVFETQLANILYELEGNHTYEFVEGTSPAPMAAEIQGFFPSTDEYFQYYDQTSAPSMNTALDQLEGYLASEGPFDGVIGYSQGASLAATYLIRTAQRHPSAPLPFRCAIFFSGGRPLDPRSLDEDRLVLINPDGVTDAVVAMPTANIWGRNDRLWPGSSEILFKLCDPAVRSSCIHDEGHDIPGARAKDAIQGSVRAIRRAIDKANLSH
ncbi:serine hydrolase FSH [Apodospora peruviana]|uniref:Serine hydrolase FSH n=1 Tax=Apodospora peruviana TaxID=516989 RepID=A0AAE0IBN5_9PEZI|nr:serine hydrolase FSH [Apodospora peruviana]